MVWERVLGVGIRNAEGVGGGSGVPGLGSRRGKATSGLSTQQGTEMVWGGGLGGT